MSKEWLNLIYGEFLVGAIGRNQNLDYRRQPGLVFTEPINQHFERSGINFEPSFGELFLKPHREFVETTWWRRIDGCRTRLLERISDRFCKLARPSEHKLRVFEWLCKICDKGFELIDGCFANAAQHHHSLAAKERTCLRSDHGISNFLVSVVSTKRFQIMTEKHGVAVAITN